MKRLKMPSSTELYMESVRMSVLFMWTMLQLSPSVLAAFSMKGVI